MTATRRQRVDTYMSEGGTMTDKTIKSKGTNEETMDDKTMDDMICEVFDDLGGGSGQDDSERENRNSITAQGPPEDPSGDDDTKLWWCTIRHDGGMSVRRYQLGEEIEHHEQRKDVLLVSGPVKALVRDHAFVELARATLENLRGFVQMQVWALHMMHLRETYDRAILRDSGAAPQDLLADRRWGVHGVVRSEEVIMRSYLTREEKELVKPSMDAGYERLGVHRTLANIEATHYELGDFELHPSICMARSSDAVPERHRGDAIWNGWRSSEEYPEGKGYEPVAWGVWPQRHRYAERGWMDPCHEVPLQSEAKAEIKSTGDEERITGVIPSLEEVRDSRTPNLYDINQVGSFGSGMLRKMPKTNTVATGTLTSNEETIPYPWEEEFEDYMARQDPRELQHHMLSSGASFVQDKLRGHLREMLYKRAKTRYDEVLLREVETGSGVTTDLDVPNVTIGARRKAEMASDLPTVWDELMWMHARDRWTTEDIRGGKAFRPGDVRTEDWHEKKSERPIEDYEWTRKPLTSDQLCEALHRWEDKVKKGQIRMGRSSAMQEEEPVIIGPYVAAKGMGRLMRRFDDLLMARFWQPYPLERGSEEPLELVLEDFHMHDIRAIVGYAKKLQRPLTSKETIQWFNKAMDRRQLIAAGDYRGLVIGVFIELVSPMMIESSDSRKPFGDDNAAYRYAYMISHEGWSNVKSGSISERESRGDFNVDPPTRNWSGIQRGFKTGPEALNAAIEALEGIDYHTYENETASIVIEKMKFTDTGEPLILPLRRLYSN